jgi:hypothetical protein
VDPQSTLLHNSNNVLETPSLKDVSECTSHDVPRGEAAVERHDAAPTRVNAMATSCSPITAKHVADEGSVRDSPETLFSFASSISSPSLDNESTNSSISSFSQQTASPESGDAPASDQRSATILPHCTPPVGINNMLAVPRSPSNSRFSCPQCPRKFSTLVKARYGKFLRMELVILTFPSQSSLSKLSACTLLLQPGVQMELPAA